MKYIIGDNVDYLNKHCGTINRCIGEIVSIKRYCLFLKRYIIEQDVTIEYMDDSYSEYVDYFMVKESNIIKKVRQRE